MTNFIKPTEKIRNHYQSLSVRERLLVNITAVAFALVFIYWLISGVVNYHNDLQISTIRKESSIAQVELLAYKHKNLKTKLFNLTTKYLNSSLSYEQLTNHLDKIAKTEIGSDTYELIPSRDKIELGAEFLAQKFTIKIRKCSFEQIVNIMKSLEQGPPPVFVQKVDIAKSSDHKSNSVVFEIVSIQEIKN